MGKRKAVKDVTTRYDGGVPKDDDGDAMDAKAGVRYDGFAGQGGAVSLADGAGVVEQSAGAAVAGMEAHAANAGDYAPRARGRRASSSKYDASLPGSRQTERAPGRYDEPAGNHPVSQDRSQAAAGHPYSEHPATGGWPASHLNYQASMSPQAGASVPAVQGGGPLREAIRHHNVVRAGMMNQAAAASPNLAPQLGQNAPMGVTGMPRFDQSTSSNVPGRQASPAPHPDGARGPGYVAPVPFADRFGPGTDRTQPRKPAPGSEWSSKVPGS